MVCGTAGIGRHFHIQELRIRDDQILRQFSVSQHAAGRTRREGIRVQVIRQRADIPVRNKALVVVFWRSAADPVSVVPFTMPKPGAFSPDNILSHNSALPPRRVTLKASRIPLSKIFTSLIDTPA